MARKRSLEKKLILGCFLVVAITVGTMGVLYHLRETRCEAILLTAALRENLPPDLLMSLARVESTFNPEAVSSCGAQGLLQVMPATFEETAKRVGLKNGDPLDPEDNARIGAAYLKRMLELYDGDEYLALAAYNSGPSNVRKFREGKRQKTGREIIESLPEDWEKLRVYVLRIQAGRADFIPYIKQHTSTP